MQFGAELALALPWAYFLHTCGLLTATRSCGDMAAFYFFSHNHTNELDCVRTHVVSGWPGTVGAYDSFVKERWIPPPIAAHWRTKAPPLAALRLDDRALGGMVSVELGCTDRTSTPTPQNKH